MKKIVICYGEGEWRDGEKEGMEEGGRVEGMEEGREGK